MKLRYSAGHQITQTRPHGAAVAGQGTQSFAQSDFVSEDLHRTSSLCTAAMMKKLETASETNSIVDVATNRNRAEFPT